MLMHVMELETTEIGHVSSLSDLATDGMSAHPPQRLAMRPVVEDEALPLVDQLLTALAAMAVRSKRRQADLNAAMRRSGLAADGDAVGAALRQLERSGFIENLVPLYDGGMLMSVTSRGVETLNAHTRWPMLDSREMATFYGKVA
jgi:hypothetical protein